jgi:hypothetical protein
MFPVIAAKAIDWAHEKEVRILLPQNPLQDGVRVPISPACIKGVCLGCRSSPKTEEQVRSVLRSPKFQNVKLIKAEINPSEYALTFIEIC